MRKTQTAYYYQKRLTLAAICLLSIFSFSMFAYSEKTMYFGAAIGVYQDSGLGDFQSAYKTNLKAIANNIDFTNRAFFEQSNAGSSVDISFGGVLMDSDAYYLEGSISYVLSKSKEANSVVTDSTVQQTQVTLKHQFKERFLFMKLKYFYKFREEFHFGAGFGLANGYTFLSTTTDVSFFGSNSITKNYRGSGFAYEFSTHIKYIPKFTHRLSVVMNMGVRVVQIGELLNKGNDEAFMDQSSNPIKFNHLTLFTSLEARYLF